MLCWQCTNAEMTIILIYLDKHRNNEHQTEAYEQTNIKMNLFPSHFQQEGKIKDIYQIYNFQWLEQRFLGVRLSSQLLLKSNISGRPLSFWLRGSSALIQSTVWFLEVNSKQAWIQFDMFVRAIITLGPITSRPLLQMKNRIHTAQFVPDDQNMFVFRNPRFHDIFSWLPSCIELYSNQLNLMESHILRTMKIIPLFEHLIFAVMRAKKNMPWFCPLTIIVRIHSISETNYVEQRRTFLFPLIYREFSTWKWITERWF
jgi:hypothetical protein